MLGGNGEVDEVEVHIVEPQVLQAVFQGLCHVPVVGVPKLHPSKRAINRVGTHYLQFRKKQLEKCDPCDGRLR